MGVRSVFAVAAACMLLVGCAGGGFAPSPASSPLSPLAKPSPPGPLELTVVHSNDTWGYLDPCG